MHDDIAWMPATEMVAAIRGAGLAASCSAKPSAKMMTSVVSTISVATAQANNKTSSLVELRALS